jgi:hypothetical protein
MNHIECKCENCKIIKNKIKLYDEFIASANKINKINNNIIIEENINGYLDNKYGSDLGESFLIINEGKNLDHLGMRDRRVIMKLLRIMLRKEQGLILLLGVFIGGGRYSYFYKKSRKIDFEI